MPHHPPTPIDRRDDPPRAAPPLGHGARGARPSATCWPSRAAWPRAATGVDREPARAAAAALPGQGEARHPPVHERRAVARRHVRPQAGCSTKYAGKPLPTANLRTERQDRGRVAVAVQVPEVRPERASRSASSSRTPREHIDDICVIRSMHADVPNHEPSLLLMNCGEAPAGRGRASARG